MKSPGEERCKSIFIHYPFSLPSGALKCVLSNSANRIYKNELGPKIERISEYVFLLPRYGFKA
jgi:hypothetical protein